MTRTCRSTVATALVLALTFTGAGYVRREWRPRQPSATLVGGSRDRTLNGKARVRARRAEPLRSGPESGNVAGQPGRAR